MIGVFADMATAYLLRASELFEARQLAGQLQAALDSRVVIEQAKGIIASEYGVSVDEAFEMLREHSRLTNVKLGEVCRAVVHMGLRIPLRNDQELSCTGLRSTARSTWADAEEEFLPRPPHPWTYLYAHFRDPLPFLCKGPSSPLGSKNGPFLAQSCTVATSRLGMDLSSRIRHRRARQVALRAEDHHATGGIRDYCGRLSVAVRLGPGIADRSRNHRAVLTRWLHGLTVSQGRCGG